MKLPLLFVAALAFFCMSAISWSASASFGAIAFDQATGRYGFSWGKSSRAEANESAKKDCASEGCKLFSVTPGRCGALATAEDQKDSNAWGISTRPDKGDAEARAIANCQKHTAGQCKVRGSDCNR
jgi:hypothetical protein